MRAWAWRPGIRADRDLGPLRPARQSHRVSSFGKKIIRNEFVEAFVTLVNQIEFDDARSEYGFPFHGGESLMMLLENRLEATLHLTTVRDFVERLHSQVANQLFDERIVRISFDHLHQLQRRLLQLDTLRR